MRRGKELNLALTTAAGHSLYVGVFRGRPPMVPVSYRAAVINTVEGVGK